MIPYFSMVGILNYGQGEGVGAIGKGIFDIPLYSKCKREKMKLSKAHLLAVASLLDARDMQATE